MIAAPMTPVAVPTPASPSPAAPVQGSGGSDPKAFGRELQRASEASSKSDTGAEDPSDAAAPEADGSEAPPDTARAMHKSAPPIDRRGRSAATGPAVAAETRESAASAASAPVASGARPPAPSADDEDSDAATDLSAVLAGLADRTASTSHAASPGTAAAIGESGKGLASTLEAPQSAQPDRTRKPHAALHDPLQVRSEAPGASTSAAPSRPETGSAFGTAMAEAVASLSKGVAADQLRPEPAPAGPSPAAGVTQATPRLDADIRVVLEDTLATPVGSREFAHALGARLAVFAHNGVEHARLNLHPADMGPIALQLALDGTQLRVDLAAELAATRQILEQSLPSLAAALRESGFTLSGGGVFQQAREGGTPGGSGSSPLAPADGVAAGAEAAPSSQPTLVTRAVRLDGLVDLYA